jgi:predicted dehydrogenase
VIRIGIIGCGAALHRNHLPALRQLPHARIVAATDLDPARLPAVPTFPDAQSLLDSASIDIAAILTPPHTHFELARLAITRNCHVLLEKPAALTLPEIDELNDLAARANRHVQVNFHLRFHRLVRQAAAALPSLGALHTARAVWNAPLDPASTPPWKLDPARGGGPVFEIAANLFDLLHHLLDDGIVSLHAVSPHPHTAAILVQYRRGATASLHVSADAPHNIELDLAGPDARLSLQAQRFDGLELLARHETPGQPAPRLRALNGFLRQFPAGLAAMSRGGDYAASYVDQWRQLLDAVQFNTPVTPNLHDARHSLAAILATLESIQSGHPACPR